MTYREIISNIRQSEKILSSEIDITDRFLQKQVRNAANLIVNQQLNKRQLWSSPNIFTTLPCLEMETIPLKECCEYSTDRLVAISKETLPGIGEGIFGLAIQYATGLDNMKKFKEITPIRYVNFLNLNLKTNDVYFWILNNRIVITNPDTKNITFSAYFTEDISNSLLFPLGCDCKNPPTEEQLCLNPLDKEFKFPANRMIDVEKIVTDGLQKGFNRKKDQSTTNNKEGD